MEYKWIRMGVRPTSSEFENSHKTFCKYKTHFGRPEKQDQFPEHSRAVVF